MDHACQGLEGGNSLDLFSKFRTEDSLLSGSYCREPKKLASRMAVSIWSGKQFTREDQTGFRSFLKMTELKQLVSVELSSLIQSAFISQHHWRKSLIRDDHHHTSSKFKAFINPRRGEVCVDKNE